MNPSECTVLVVDDEPSQAELIRRVLSGAGYKVVMGLGGEVGIHQVKEQRFDLIITDLAMPQLSGLELIQAIRSQRHTAHIPIIAVSAHTWELVIQTAADLGCDAFVAKPFAPAELLDTVAKTLAGGNHVRPTIR
jgi:two-component system, OmpR family, phosphate regulon response regulator PhoB